jgi:hypothetical protein
MCIWTSKVSTQPYENWFWKKSHRFGKFGRNIILILNLKVATQFLMIRWCTTGSRNLLKFGCIALEIYKACIIAKFKSKKNTPNSKFARAVVFGRPLAIGVLRNALIFLERIDF